ncbi:hypothetical protein Hdeb2414_s0016g00490181 [Helianthus debilis subsp. tardiflorus]
MGLGLTMQLVSSCRLVRKMPMRTKWEQDNIRRLCTLTSGLVYFLLRRCVLLAVVHKMVRKRSPLPKHECSV